VLVGIVLGVVLGGLLGQAARWVTARRANHAHRERPLHHR
jgi:hypothetical protein